MSIVLNSVQSTQPLVALTFDDGPDERYTPLLLDIFEQEDVHATFFIRGSALNAETRAIVARMANAGHDIGNHTHNHFDLGAADAATVREEVSRTHYQLESIIGQPPTLLRPPYGNGPDAANEAASALGYRATVLWTSCGVDWDTPQPSAEVIAQRVLDGDRGCGPVAPGGIILLHDGLVPGERGDSRLRTVEAVRILVPELRARGFQLVTVSALLDASAFP